jgi:hypothetical protein
MKGPIDQIAPYQDTPKNRPLYTRKATSMQRSDTISETCVTLFTDNKTNGHKKTYIIFGMERGGTTMVAGVSKLCGLDIGQDLPVNLEDNDFNANLLRQQNKVPAIAITETLKRRNTQKKIWGWKFPRAIAYLEQIQEHITNPHLILVTRDPVATASREILSGRPKIKALDAVLNVQKRNMELVKKWQVPSLIVSYEKSIAFPEQFIDELCEFLETEKPAQTEDIISFMRPGKYKKI